MAALNLKEMDVVKRFQKLPQTRRAYVLRELLRNRKATGQRRSRSAESSLARGYRATAARDRKLAREWSKVADAWPEK